uniref:Uncharacterized protein ycf81 n=1 Tax=Mesostigma viride TaxID=41882 RepID=YCF81_MESVI|nr:hypothetical chloroplast RF81 [Mesostigma viride]Q9MUP3.1 RecName: Full=Uncharacterized protein ycf81; Short=RF81 [Mesostigma viride]AAF43857.1 hypothetical chloroplast RF81 [Mesostigma viride]WKT08216.1 hypothetical chloroplast protein RF81 [Mesostigma viride]
MYFQNIDALIFSKLLDTLLNIFFLLFFLVLGAEFTLYIINVYFPNLLLYGNALGIKFVLSILGSLIAFPIGLVFQNNYKNFLNYINNFTVDIFFTSLLSIIGALFIANLYFSFLDISSILKEFLFIKYLLRLLIQTILCYSGFILVTFHSDYLLNILVPEMAEAIFSYNKIVRPSITRVLHTSYIINHNIIAIFQSQFVEGLVLIPKSTIQELQILNNSKNFKDKYLGRLGFSRLNELKYNYFDQIILESSLTNCHENVLFKYNKTYNNEQQNIVLMSSCSNNIKESNISQLLISNLFPLIININKLIELLKLPYLSGESFYLQIVRKGKRLGQGIGYLEDGTMVIVNAGSKYIGQKIKVIVKKVWQKSTGKILFTQPIKNS